MRPYTIVKALALFFGTASVVARSLPERRSEISANAARGHGSGHLEDAGDAGSKVDLSTVTTGGNFANSMDALALTVLVFLLPPSL